MAQVADLIGAVAIFVSLVYLAMQMRQNTRSLRAENYAHALARVADMQARLSTNPDLVRFFNTGLWLTRWHCGAASGVQFTWCLYEMFGSFEFMYLQSREGALPDDVWKRWADTVSWWLQWPGVQQWWRSQPTPFSASFAAFVESRIGEPVQDTERARLWAEFRERTAALGLVSHSVRQSVRCTLPSQHGRASGRRRRNTYVCGLQVGISARVLALARASA